MMYRVLGVLCAIGGGYLLAGQGVGFVPSMAIIVMLASSAPLIISGRWAK
jgi:hypothetical protein